MNDNADTLMSLFLFDPDSMSPEQMHDLSEWILQSPENIRAFVHNAMFHRNIHELFVRSDTTDNILFPTETKASVEDGSVLNPEIWRLLSEDEKTAPSVHRPKPKKEPVVVAEKLKIETAPRKINKFSIASAIVSLAAVLFIIIYLHVVPVTIQQEVATVTDMMDAQWAKSASAIKKGSRISTNTEPLMLRKGIARLSFDNDISLLIEAPAEFVLITADQVKLNYGRLYAIVPQQAIGFTVTTPNSKIIDLGTEFGVQVDFGETTELHVIKGKTTLVADQAGQKVSLQVSQGMAKRISDRSSQVTDIQCDTGLFVRDIRSENHMIWRGQALALSDMINLVRPDVSKTDKLIVQNEILESSAMAPGEFWPLEANPFVDGLFVPNGINGPVWVTQDGTFSWDAPAMETRQKIGYLRFDISSVKGNRAGAALTLSIRKWAGRKGRIHVYGVKDGDADLWDESQITYNTAAGCLSTALGRYELDRDVLNSLGTITLTGTGTQQSNVSGLRFDEFIAQDTNGLLTVMLVREQNDITAEWLVRTKEAGSEAAPTLTFPDADSSGVREVSTADGRGADTYLSNDNQYDSTGPDANHGAEPVFKIRNFLKNKSYVLNAKLTEVQDELFAGMRRLSLNGRVCGAADYPAIAMRANSAITFDLRQIRHCFNGTLTLKSFTAMCGPADVSEGYLNRQQWSESPQAGFYVLVDGQERFAEESMKAGQQPEAIDIELKPQDRYLTLVMTGGTNRKAPIDWGLFVCPQINSE